MTQSIAIRVAVLVAASVLLTGCGASNMSSYLADSLPHWMGGLPADAPPRENDPRYADYYRPQIAAREKAEAMRAQLNAHDALIKSAQGDYDRLTHAQTAQSARRQMPARDVAQAVAHEVAREVTQEIPADKFSLNGRALY